MRAELQSPFPPPHQALGSREHRQGKPRSLQASARASLFLAGRLPKTLLLLAALIGMLLSQDSVLAQAPYFSRHPTNQYVCAGLNASFVAAAGGILPLRYQWQFNGADIPGATSSVLNLTQVGPEQGGVYRVVATNNLGSASSSNATLVVGNVTVGGTGVSGPIPLDATNVIQVAGGGSHALALRADGTVIAWGANWFGQCNVPAGLSNVVEVAAGDKHSLARLADGRVVGWGANYYGLTNVPAQLTNAVSIASRGDLCMAAAKDGSVVVWGYITSGQVQGPVGVKIVSVAVGYRHGLALTADGKVKTWAGLQPSLYALPNVSGVVAIAAGDYHSAALLNDGRVLVWGENNSGQTNVPPDATNLVAIAAGANFTVGLRRDGSVVSWGSTTWSPPAGFTNAIAVGAASTTPIAVRNFGAPTITVSPPAQTGWDGGALTLSALAVGEPPLSYQWLFNGEELGGATDGVLRLSGLRADQAGEYRMVACNARGCVTSAVGVVKVRPQVSVAAWGANGHGECFAPPGLSNLVGIVSRYGHTLALRDDGTVAAWGDAGGYESVRPLDATNLVAIDCGSGFNVGLRDDGRLLMWGPSATGVLTNLFYSDRYCVAMAAGGGFVVGLRRNGTVFSTPPGLPGVSGVTALAADEYHALFLKSDGTVLALIHPWFSPPRYGLDTVPAGLSNVTAIACGGSHNLALKADGTVVAWGDNSYGQTNVPPTATNVVAIAAGSAHSLARRADGTVVSWGDGMYGQLAVPSGLTNIQSIAAGDGRNVLLVADRPICITQQPRGITTPAGHSASFGVGASGAAPVTYQWQFEGVDIPDATNLVLTLTNVQPAHAGNYRVILTNSEGSVTSQWAALTLGPVLAWGANVHEQASVPAGLTNPALVACGLVVSTVLTRDGRVAQFGRLDAPPAGLGGVVVVAAGNDVAAAATDDGFVHAWGLKVGRPPPVYVGDVRALAVGEFHCLALRRDGTVVAWDLPLQHGYVKQESGQTIVPADLTNAVAVAAGQRHSAALREDGTVVVWGSLTSAPAGLSNVVAIASGSQHLLALQADGSVTQWGSGIGLNNFPAGLSNVVSLGVGEFSSLAVRDDGSLALWGFNSSDVLTVANTLTNVVRAAAGLWHRTAILGDGKPELTVEPFNRRINAGGELTLHVKAAGSRPLQYQWRFNGADIAGATDATLVLTNLPYSAAGEYVCVVSNALGAVTSAVSQVTVQRPPLRLSAVPAGTPAEPRVRLRVSGLSEMGPVVLHASTNLTFWEPVVTHAPVFGAWEYLDAATNAGPRFYRASEGP